MKKGKKMALGRGLDDLLGEVESAYEHNLTIKDSDLTVGDIDIDKIDVNPYQPRKIFDEEKLDELSQSIKKHGILQPIIISKREDRYLLIAGERRLRASKLANLDAIKAITMDIEDKKLREYALIENIQRDDLNILEIAYSYSALINEHNITHEELSKMVYKSRSSITNILRLLKLTVYAQQMVSEGKITLGHAKLIVVLEEKMQNKIIDLIIKDDLSVANTSNVIKKLTTKTKAISTKNSIKYDTKEVNNIIDKLKENNLKAKVTKDKFIISINSQDDIDKILKYFV